MRPAAGTASSPSSRLRALAAPFERAIRERVRGRAQTQADDVEPAQQLTALERLVVEGLVEQLGQLPLVEPANLPGALPCGDDIALTATRLPGGGATVEVARLQPDGTWRWVIDQPSVLPLNEPR